MTKTDISIRDLMDAGCHFGHSRGRRHPNMAEYVYITREKINIINLEKTLTKLKDLTQAVEDYIAAGNVMVLVGTKRQAQEIVQSVAKKTGLPYVTERWLGGILTNYDTVKVSIKRMNDLEKFLASNDSEELTKRERLMQQRDLDRMKMKFGGLADITKLPDGLFVIDPSFERNAVAEAKKLGQSVFALLDTNSNPLEVDEFVPANDDASKSIMLIMEEVSKAIERGQKRAQATAVMAEKNAAKEEAKEEVKKAVSEVKADKKQIKKPTKK